MSHIVQIETQVRDPVAAAAACRRLGWEAPSTGTAELFSGEESGLIVQPHGWKYPAVFDTTTGEVRFDTFEGHWGDQSLLNAFLQMYAVEKARLEARRNGHSVTEQPLEDGSIKLTVNVGGAA